MSQLWLWFCHWETPPFKVSFTSLAMTSCEDSLVESGKISTLYTRKIRPALTTRGVFEHILHEAVLKSWGVGKGERGVA